MVIHASGGPQHALLEAVSKDERARKYRNFSKTPEASNLSSKMKKSSPPPPGFGSPRRRGATSFAYTPTKGPPLPRLERASTKRKRYDRSGPTTKGSPSDEGSQACHSGIVDIEQNCRARKKSEIIDDTKDDQTDRSDIDGDGAAKRQKSKNYRGLKVTLLASSGNYTVDGKPVETQRFRVEEQGQKVLEFEMYKGVLIDERTVVSSFPELTNIFEETFVNQFSRRIEGDTFDSAEREAWEAGLKHITASQFGQSTFTADQIRNNTQNRAKSKDARKFARGVNHIHTDGARRPSSLFIALARAISYKGSDDIDGPSHSNTIHMHFDRVFAATERANDSIVSRLRATAIAQAADDGDATDEALALSVKCMRYINGRLYRVIKNVGDIKGQAAPLCCSLCRR